MVEENVRLLAEAGESLVNLRDIKYWLGKVKPKYSPAKKRAKALAWMRTQGTLVLSSVLERILKQSGKYGEEEIDDFIKWAKEYSKTGRDKKDSSKLTLM